MIVRMVRQRDNGDCGVACLAMLFDVPYEAVAQAAVATKQTLIWNGAYDADLRAIAVHLGGKLIRRNKFNADIDRGIAWFSSGDGRGNHVAFLAHGLVFDTDGAVYPWRDYLTTMGYKLVRIYAKREKGEAK